MNTLNLHLLSAIALAILFTATGCSTRYIREAQTHWSRAATVENQLSAEGYNAENALMRQIGAVTDYKMALALLERELARNERQLRKDGLYETALLLKAMCLWRVADLEDESASKQTYSGRLSETLGKLRTNQYPDLSFGERDRVVVAALPGLRDHDRGLAAMDYTNAQSFFRSSLTTLDKAIQQTPEMHPIRVYLFLAQLSTCRAWQSAAFAHAGGSMAQGAAAAREPTEKARTILKELETIAGQRDSLLQGQITVMKSRLGVN